MRWSYQHSSATAPVAGAKTSLDKQFPGALAVAPALQSRHLCVPHSRFGRRPIWTCVALSLLRTVGPTVRLVRKDKLGNNAPKSTTMRPISADGGASN